MANVIKHKRGSGSDPGASDLVVGEVAIRTDVGKLFTKMDNGSVAEIAGGGSDIAINTLSSSSATGGGSATFNGSAYRFTLSAPPSVSAQQLLVSINGVIQKPVAGTGQPSEGFSVDGTDIILGDAPATGADFFILTFKSLGVSEPADNSVTSAKIADGAIVNADINASAAIAGTKISPNFGGQNILTTGQVQISGALPTIVLNDENNENDFNIQNINGTFAIGDIDAGAARLEINSSGVATFRKNLNALEGLDVTGAITGTGDLTIDTNTLHVDSSNNRVGIGTTSPSDDLEIASNHSQLRLTDTDDSKFVQFSYSGGKLITRNNSTSTTTAQFTLDESGRLGIGTISPSNNLEVASAAHTGISIQSNRTTSTDNIGALDFISSSTNVARIQTLVDGTIKFRNTSALHERMRIDSSGRVLIGRTSTAASDTAFKLQVFHPSGSIMGIGNTNVSSSGVCTLAFMPSNSVTGADIICTAEEDFSSSANRTANLSFRTRLNGTLSERMRIDSSGKVGIGKTPSSMLDIETNSNQNGFNLNCIGTPANYFFNIRDDNVSKFYINSSGNVGIGTTSPVNPLHVTLAGTDIATFESTDAGASGAQVSFKHTSASPADNDTIANLTFDGRDDGNNATTYAQLRVLATDVSNTSESGAYQFFTRNAGTFAERMRIQSGGGISFNGDTAAANALDDYEEGTWTPASNTGNTAQSSGSYTKIGRMVYAAFNIDISSNSNNSHATITGLPFTTENTDPNANGVAPDYQTYDVEDGPIYHVSKGGTQIILYKNNGAALFSSNISGKNLRGTAIYRTA